MSRLIEQHVQRTPANGRVILRRGAGRWLRTALCVFAMVGGWMQPNEVVARPEIFNGQWSQLALGGPAPSLPRDGAAIYDVLRDRLVAINTDGVPIVLDFTTGASAWADIGLPTYTLTSLSSRAVYDDVNDRMVVINSDMRVSALSLSNPTGWVDISPENATPRPRPYFAVALDTARNRLMLYGGGPTTGTYHDLWALTLTGPPKWTELVTTGWIRQSTWGPVAAYDALRDQLIVGMGATGSSYDAISSLFTLTIGDSPTCMRLQGEGVGPSGQMLSAAVYDVGADALLLFGSYPNPTSIVYSLSLGATPVWEMVDPEGTPPPTRWSYNLLYRTEGPELILLGGHLANDTWALTLEQIGPQAPVVSSFSPAGGMVATEVTLSGRYLDDATKVTFNGAVAPIYSATSGRLVTRVPDDAATGPISVSNDLGLSTTAESFFVGERPVITRAIPDSGRAGDVFELRGAHFTGATLVQVGGTAAAPFVLHSDTSITVTLDTLAVTGPVRVRTPAATGTSGFNFSIVADDPRPHLLSVRDVRSDQGGRVMLHWRASDFDQPKYRVITGYRVWRRAPLGSAAVSVQSPPPAMPARREPGGSASDPIVFWENVAELPAAFLKGYAYAAATLQDSLAEGNPWTAFFVQALTSSAYVFYNSSPDSGYSVDNLSPPAPMPFAVVYTGAGNELHWRGCAIPDLAAYEIHRGTSAAFVPSQVTLVAAVSETSYVDIPGSFHYKLAARDVHGNRSRFVSVAPENPVATLAAFIGATRGTGFVNVRWFSGGNPGLAAGVYRRTPDTEWRRMTDISADGQGYLQFEDRDVLDTQRYGYRLGIVDGDSTEVMLGEAWIDPPSVSRGVLDLGANPSRSGRIVVVLSLPPSRSATVQLFDIAGREVERQAATGAGAASRELVFGQSARLRPGVYLVRVATTDAEVTRRAVVLD